MKNIKTNKLLALLFAGLIIIFGSCNKEYDAPEFEVPTYTGAPANKTIADIIAVYNDAGKMDSICHSGESFIVKATVVSSDEGGNIYKTIYLQDETGAIQMGIDKSGLYNIYPVGQIVYINCQGLLIGNYHGIYQIGWIYQGAIGRVNGAYIDQYLFKDGLPKDLSNTIIDINSPSDLNANNVGKLVRIKNCKFADDAIGQTWATDDYTTSRNIASINHTAVSDFVVRTSQYAKFRKLLVPGGEGDLIGILSIYNSTYQLLLRTIDDVQSFGAYQDVYPMTFNSGSLSTGGWSFVDKDGDISTKWEYKTWNGSNFMLHEAATDNCEDWLVSPLIPIATVTGSTMYIEQKLDVSNTLTDYYKVYYTTDYNGDVNSCTWVELPITVYPSNFGLSNAIAVPNLSSDFRIAFKYNKTNTTDGTEWSIKSIQFNKLIQQ